MLFKFFNNKYTKKNYNYLNESFLDYPDIGSTNKVGASSYRNNVIVHKCVNLVAEAASHVPWILCTRLDKRKLYDSHGILDLLKYPNRHNSGAEFIFKIVADKLLYGNAYVAMLSCKNSKELVVLSPEETEVMVENGKITGYSYGSGTEKKIFKINNSNGASNILHIKSYNPNSDLYGISCVEAASKPIALHDNASDWNSELLKNGARPSGALMVKDGHVLTDEQFVRLREQLYKRYTGAGNASKPLLLEGGLEWKEMSMRPKDMDFLESRNTASREVALAFGVPPQLLGINGDNTYSNMQEARLGFWEETAIPLLDKLSDAFSSWFSKLYSESIHIDFDLESISALTNKRQNLWSKISSADFMTTNEKRALVGLDPIKGGDKLVG